MTFYQLKLVKLICVHFGSVKKTLILFPAFFWSILFPKFIHTYAGLNSGSNQIKKNKGGKVFFLSKGGKVKEKVL